MLEEVPTEWSYSKNEQRSILDEAEWVYAEDKWRKSNEDRGCQTCTTIVASKVESSCNRHTAWLAQSLYYEGNIDRDRKMV